MRWLIRTVFAGAIVALALGAATVAVLHASGLVALASVAICAIVLLITVRRLPRPDVRDAALFAERYGDESGAVELLLSEIPAVQADALRTLRSIRSRAFSPLLRMRDVFGLMLLMAVFGSLLALPTEERLPAEANTSYSVARESSDNAPSMATNILDEFRRSVLAASEDQRREAAKAYAALWEQRGVAIDELRAAAQAGLEDADEAPSRSVGERQANALNAALFGGLKTGDAMVDVDATGESLHAQSLRLMRTADDLAEGAEFARTLNSRPMLDLSSAKESFAATVVAGNEGEPRPSGSLPERGGGHIAIAPGVWQTGAMPPKESAAFMPLSVTEAMERYTSVFED